MGTPTAVGQTYITPLQIAKELQVAPQTVYAWIKEGTIPSCKKGGAVQVVVSEYEAWLEKARQEVQGNKEKSIIRVV